MSLFGRKQRAPRPLEWGSSFAEAETLTRRSRGVRRGGPSYDAAGMATPPPSDDRPIGSRRRDVRPPAPVGSLPPKPRRGAAHRIASILLLLAALVLIGGLVWVALGVFGGGSDTKSGTPVKIVIPKGATSSEIAGILADKDVVGRESVFRARLKLNGDGDNFRAGTHTLKTGSSYDTIVRELSKAPVAAPTFNVTIPEGQRLEETAALIDDMRASRTKEG
ncbi:MAG: mltG, partial [Thermoleophilia bacterium]|nr:mltG [Thermoleophilia bacterium]